MSTTRQDKATDILLNAIDECVRQGYLSQHWADQLEKEIEDTLEMDEEFRTPEQYWEGVNGLLDQIRSSALKKGLKKEMVH